VAEAFAGACAAIYADPDPEVAWRAANELQALVARLNGEAANFRATVLLSLRDYHGLDNAKLARRLGLSRPQVSTLIKRATERGNTVTNPTTTPILPPVVLAVITSPDGRALMARRKDDRPPWTFLGGDAEPGESADKAARRRVLAESGLTVTDTSYIGERVHPRTSRHMIYVHATVADPDSAKLTDTKDHSELKWLTIPETAVVAPDMYEPVRQYLDRLADSLASEDPS